MAGFTSVDNEFFELIPLLSGNELKILLTIIRKTYGWHKESTILKLTEISQLTGISWKNISSPINSLVEKGFIRKHRIHGEGLRYRFCIAVKDKDLANCYEAHTSETCPYNKTQKTEPYCLKCPRYLLKNNT